MICRWVVFNSSKISRTLSPLFTKSSSSVAKLEDETFSTANCTSDYREFYQEILFGMKKIGFRKFLNGDQFRGLVSDLRQVHVEEIMSELMVETPDLSVWFFKELKEIYGFRHSRYSTFLVSHVLAHQKRFKELQLILEQLLLDEGSGSASLLCEILSNSFRNWDSTGVVWDMLLFISSRSKMVADSVYILENMKDLKLNVSTQAYNSMLSNFRETDKMWDLYKEMDSRGIYKNQYTYSTVIDGLCKQQKLKEAVLFLRNTEWKEIGPSLTSLNSLMSSYCKLGYVDIAKSFLSTILKCGLIPSVYSHNILIHGHCLAGSIEEALEMSSSHGVKPDSVTYNILAKGFHLLGMINGVWEVVQEMLDKGLSPDVITYTILLCGYCQLGNIDKGLRLLKDMFSTGFELNCIPCSVMLNSLCKRGRISEALSLFYEMKDFGFRPDLVAYSIVIHGLCRLGELEIAVGLFEEMCGKRILPNSRTHGAILLGLCRKGMLSEARTFLDSLISAGSGLDLILYNIVIDGYAKAGCIDEALRLFKVVNETGITPSVSTFNSLIYGYCETRNLAEARVILNVIKLYGLIPSPESYTILMNAYAEFGDLESIDELCQEMKVEGVSMTRVTYSVIIKGLCKARKLEKCNQVLRDMYCNGVTPDQITYNTIIHHLCRSKHTLSKAFELFQEMKSWNLEPSSATYNVLINGLCCYGEVRAADRFLSLLQEQKIRLTKFAYTTLIKAHCVKGDPERAVQLFLELFDCEFDVDIADYSAVINRLCRRKLGNRSKFFFCLMISQGILPDLEICEVMFKSLQCIDVKSSYEVLVWIIKLGFKV